MCKKYLLYIEQNYSFDILRPVQKAIRARGYTVAWFVQGNQVNLDYLRADEHCLTSVDEIFSYQPDAILCPSNLIATFLPGIKVAVFHGFDAGKIDKKGNNDHFKIRNCFDLYCTQGPSSTWGFEALRQLPAHFKIIETGWCALDNLYQAEEQSLMTNKHKPTILLCSTFTKKLTCAPHLFEKIKQLSATGKWQWLVQFHPKMDEKIVEQYKSIQGENLTFVETDSIYPLLQAADVMVCDTSSVLMMFLLLNKPVVTFNNIAPSNCLIDISDPELLATSIEKALTRPAVLMENIQAFINENHPYQDGKSSERLLDAIDVAITEKDQRASKPYDFIRQIKMRKKLRYWKL